LFRGILEPHATLKGKDCPVTFEAKLGKWKGKKVKMVNEPEALTIKRSLNVPYVVSHIVQQEKRRHPLPPFITSRFNRRLTGSFLILPENMRIGPGLYEGVDLGPWYRRPYYLHADGFPAGRL